MTDEIKAPWTREQVDALNAWQRAGLVHPFTCANRDTSAHDEPDPEGDWGVLIATPQGWICRHCDYMQDWAHASMADPELLRGLREQLSAPSG